jgi:hypothetical protein
LGTLTRGHDNQWYHRWQRDKRYSLVFLHPGSQAAKTIGKAQSRDPGRELDHEEIGGY